MIGSFKPGIDKNPALRNWIFFKSYTILKIKNDLICLHVTFTNHNTTLSLDPISEENLRR